MAFVVRRVTIGKARELYNDLLANLSNVGNYDSSAEYVNDLELFTLMSNWIRLEEMRETDETKMDGEEDRGY
jgi:hypothetical protein